MEKTSELKVSASQAAQIEVSIRKHDEAIRQVFKQMKKDQAEIEKLKAQTRAMLAELRTAA